MITGDRQHASVERGLDQELGGQVVMSALIEIYGLTWKTIFHHW